MGMIRDFFEPLGRGIKGVLGVASPTEKGEEIGVNFSMAGECEVEAEPVKTPEQRIIRCANDLLEAVIAAGYTLHRSDNVSGLDVDIFARDGHLSVNNIMGDWRVRGATRMPITFRDMREPCETEA